MVFENLAESVVQLFREKTKSSNREPIEVMIMIRGMLNDIYRHCFAVSSPLPVALLPVNSA